MKIYDDPLTDPKELREEAAGMTPAARLRRAAALRHRAAAAAENAKKSRRDAQRFHDASNAYIERAAALEDA